MLARLRSVTLLGAFSGSTSGPNWETLRDIIKVDQLGRGADRGAANKIGLAGLFEVPVMETSVTEDGALHIKEGSVWRLLLEFLTPGGVADQGKAVKRITEVAGELDLQSAQKARIEETVIEALRKAVQRGARDQQCSAVSIRVWISDLSTACARSSPDTWRGKLHKGGGWGFFLLEMQEGASQNPQVESHRVIEVYLYQERALTKRGGSYEKPTHSGKSQKCERSKT